MKNYIGYFLILSRRKKIALQLYLDALLLAVSFAGAMLLRLESLNFVEQPVIVFALLLSIIVTLLVFWKMGLYRVIVRFVTGRLILISWEVFLTPTFHGQFQLFLQCLLFFQ